VVTRDRSAGGEPKPKLFGIDVSIWISFAALVLSLATGLWAVVGYLTGPRVSMLSPTSVTFRFWEWGESLALTATTMNFINDGRKDYDALVLEERAVLTFFGSGRQIELSWWWFLDADGAPKEQAHPVVVPGAGVASHETRFAPILEACPETGGCEGSIAYKNFMSWKEFLRLASDRRTLPSVDVTFRARVKERSERVLERRCQVSFNDRGREQLAQELARLADGESGRRREYFSFPCIERG
jgi:hypothetical protein